MLCIVCSSPIPIPIYRDEHKLCKSCASHIRLKNNAVKEFCSDADLESVQRQLLNDLNLEEDSDYVAELNYLREAKRTLLLSKEKSFGPSFERDVKRFSPDQLEKETNCDTTASPLKLNGKSDEHLASKFSNFKFGGKGDEPQPQTSCDCGQLQPRGRIRRRVAINRDIKYSVVSVKKENEISNQLPGVACRAVSRPTTRDKDPEPQFEKIESTGKASSTNESVIVGNRNPFICPVTFCRNIIPVSDLIKHFKLNHVRVPVVPVYAGACTNLFWETKVDQFGTSQCLMLLLCKGIGKAADCVPFAIMTTKVRLSDLMEMNYVDDRHFYLIWLTAMSSSLEPVLYTITAWGGRVHIVNTTQSYSIRADPDPKTVYRSGVVMMLTSEQINRLSDGSQDMVKLQVAIH